MSATVPSGTPDIGELLGTARTIAVVGASPEPWRPSFGISRYLKTAGYRMIPVNPTHAGEMLHGEPVVASLREIAEPIDLVDVFRRSDRVGEIVDDAIAVGARAIWFQLGIRNDEAALKAADAGLAVVANRCISVEHARLRR